MIVKTKSPIVDGTALTQFYKNSAMGEGMGEYETAGGGSYGGTHYGVDGPDSSDAVFKKEMAEGEGEGEYWTAGGGSYLGVDGPDSNDAVFKKEMAEGEGEGEYWTAGGGSMLGADGDWSQSGSKWRGTMSSADGVEDNFKAKQISTGGVTIKTDNPVYEDTAMQEHEFLSSFGGSKAMRRAKRASRKSKRRAKGSFGDRVSSGFGKVRDSGILQTLGGALGMGGQGQGQGNMGMQSGFDPMMNPNPLPPAPAPRGMSTGAKVGITLGVLAVVGVGFYLYSKNKGKGKGGKK